MDGPDQKSLNGIRGAQLTSMSTVKLEFAATAVDTGEMVIDFKLARSTEVSKISYYCFSSRMNIINLSQKNPCFKAEIKVDAANRI